MASHSSILGGSNAARLLACPASYAEQMKAPVGDVESVYAAEGTALHLAIANCIESKVPPALLLGESFYGFEITEERVKVLETALTAMNDLLDSIGEAKRFKVLGMEQTLSLPGVIGAFGSVDLILADKRSIVVLDWKFGSGVPVKALYEDKDGEYLNPQLAFYTASARHRYKRRFKGKNIICAVVQPRLDPPATWAATNDEELDEFLKSFHTAFLEALGRNAHREKGEHCRFASCKVTCPLWTGPVIDLALIDPAKAALKINESATAYGEFLSRALEMAEIAETWAVEARRQGHVFLEDGGLVPGWKTVPKRAMRKWIDEKETAARIRKLGGTLDDMYTQPELKSVAQMEAALKPKGLVVPADLHHAVSSGTTIARSDDARPATTHSTVVGDLRQALKALG
jgi:hypothetical protein